MQHPAVNVFLNRLRNEDGDTIRQWAGDVQSLLDHPGWHVIQLLLSEAIESTRFILEGDRIHEHVEYSAMIGKLRGLQYAQAAADAVLEQASRVEEQARQAALREEYANG